jgi:Protein of unknown function (DUF1838)
MLNALLQSPFDRRDLLKLMAGAIPGAVLTTSIGAPGLASAAGIVSMPMGPVPKGFDPLSPKQNLEAFVRMTRSLDSAATSVGWFGGRIFSVIGDKEIIKPLFDVEGFGVGRTLAQADGSYKAMWREVGYYKDLATGKIMETWNNPLLNGETCEVYPINNDPVNSVLRPEFTLGFGATKDQTTQKIQFLLPWHFVGDNAMSAFDVNLDWKSPLDPKVWKRESPGERVRVSEYQQWRVDAKQLVDSSVASLKPYGSWNRVATWLPWMLMGQREGHLFYRSHTLKLDRVEDLPKDILAYTEKRFPKYLEAPKEWVQPNVSSFEMFARDRKPKT